MTRGGWEMSSYQVNKLLFDAVHDPNLVERYKKSEMEVLDQYKLKAEEIIAFKNADPGALYKLGATPLLLIPGLIAIKKGPRLIFNLMTRYFGARGSARIIGILVQSLTAKIGHKRNRRIAAKMGR
jgi:hypothetical protein